MTVRFSEKPPLLIPPDSTPASRAFGERIAREFGIPPQLGEILAHRGYDSSDAVRDFLHPRLSMLPAPDTMRGMDRAVSCILHCCRNDQPIFIHGDYDVDGITATALLVAFFREIGKKALFAIPKRLEEKYGLSIASIDRLIGQSQARGGVLISVDCGISAVQEVAYANQLGLRVIVTDHHEPQERLPDAEAILNPKQPGCTFPFAALAGVGVAFFLIIALRRAFIESGLLQNDVVNLKQYLDLVALGTVADVVPLVGVNRILVKAGLEVLSAKHRLGVLSLCEQCGLEGREVLAEDIAYKLAPRINAAGRLGDPRKGVDLLLAESVQQARQLASDLEQMNEARKQLELRSLAIMTEVCAEKVRIGHNGLVAYQHDCHPGVLGILASRIAERFQRPAILFTDDTQTGSGLFLKGSGRSVRGVHLFQILEQCSPWIEQYGGHAMAVGLTIKAAHLEQFSALFHQKISITQGESRGGSQAIRIDCQLQNEEGCLTATFGKALQLLQPFGEGNPEPIFLLTGQQLLTPKNHNGHLMFQIKGSSQKFPGIGFHLARAAQDFQQPVDLVFQLKRSWFKGVSRDQIHALYIASP